MIKYLLPTVWRRSELPLRRIEEHPFFALQREMNQMFDEIFRGSEPATFGGARGLGAFTPSIDVREDEKEVSIKAELPGMDEKDVEVTLTENSLTIRGEKKEEKEDKDKDCWHRETTYGSFSRVIPLSDGLDTEKIEARFKNGVLTITLPRKAEAKAKERKIAVKAE